MKSPILVILAIAIAVAVLVPLMIWMYQRPVFSAVCGILSLFVLALLKNVIS